MNQMAGRTSRVGGVFFIPIGNGPPQLEHAGVQPLVRGLRDSVFHAGNGSCIYAAQKATLGVMTLVPYMASSRHFCISTQEMLPKEPDIGVAKTPKGETAFSVPSIGSDQQAVATRFVAW